MGEGETLRERREPSVVPILLKLALKGEDNPEVFTPGKSAKLN
ncbi:hypothetical protein [Nostoc sp.]